MPLNKSEQNDKYDVRVKSVNFGCVITMIIVQQPSKPQNWGHLALSLVGVSEKHGCQTQWNP